MNTMVAAETTTTTTTTITKKKKRTKKSTSSSNNKTIKKPKLEKEKTPKEKTQAKKTNKKDVPFSSPLTAAFINDNETSQKKKKDYDKSRKKKEYKKEKQQQQQEKELQEEQRLTAQIFGGGGGVEVEEEKEKVEDVIDYEEEEDVMEEEEDGEEKPLFEISRTGVATTAAAIPAPSEDEDGIMDEVDYEEESSDGDDDDDGEEEHDDDESEDDDEDNQKDESAFDASKPAWEDKEDAENDNNNSVSLMTNARTRKLRTSASETQSISKADYEERLRTRFSNTVSRSTNIDWAALPSEEHQLQLQKKKEELDSSDEEEEDPAMELLDSNAPLLSTASSTLPPTTINLRRLPDVNLCDSKQLNATVQSVKFYPKEEEKPMVLTAGMDKMLRFYRVGAGEDESSSKKKQEGISKKIQGVYFKNLPIYSASFLGTTGNVVVSGRRPFFYIYDVVAGKIDHVPRILGRSEKSLEKFTTSPDGKLIAFVGNDGYIILVDARSKHWVADLKLNGSVRAITFTPDSQFILGSGSDGEVYRFDIRSKRCLDRFQNEDGTITSSMDVRDRFLAVGAESGVVNLYDDNRSNDPSLTSSSAATADEWGSPTDFFSPYDLQPQRRPIKSIMNLQTSADVVKFNSDGQILAMSTRREKNGLRLLHVPTATVFSNWPTTKTPLGYVWSMDFSPNSKYFAMGNDKGKCLLYKLQHYGDGKY